MQSASDGFKTRLDRLRSDIVEQSRRVQAMVEAAFDAAFAMDIEMGERVIKMDEPIDRVDVEIERACVALLKEACAEGARLGPEQVRMVLTIVKVNNELERIADVGVGVVEQIRGGALRHGNIPMPETFRVMTNSVVGILRDVSTALSRMDGKLAQVVLASEDAIEAFKKSILRDAQVRVAKGTITVDQAFALQELATYCEIMAGHCTNIAEQVLYASTGQIVRHLEGHWEKYELPT